VNKKRSYRLYLEEGLIIRTKLPRAKRAWRYRADRPTAVLDQLVRSRGKAQSLRVDNGPEFAGRMLDQWAYLNGVEIDFSRPGKPTDNAFIEALNARVRVECHNASWFLSMADARDRIEEWRCQYNDDRPPLSTRQLDAECLCRPS
jgi:putative transposase